MNQFKSEGYCVLSSVISKELRDFITQYALFDELQDFRDDVIQVPTSHAKYADPAMETLLISMSSKIEQATNLNLYPTYSYYRVYRPGHELKKHTDRASCEISATLFLNDYNMQEHWPIYVGGKRVNLSPGDMAIYKGCQIEHWRDPMKGPANAWHVQAFLHYVDANGPYSEWKWDRRPRIGVTK